VNLPIPISIASSKPSSNSKKPNSRASLTMLSLATGKSRSSASTGFAVLTPSPAIDARFFGFALQSSTFVDQVVGNSLGVAYPAISETRLGSLHLALPRSRKAQEDIIRYLEAETAGFDQGIETTRREIALVQEFRTRLIADVVTGNVDVRASAALLPELNEEEPIKEVADGEDFEEEMGDVEPNEVAA
jgi:type I restriction enzyme, S subunit